MSDLTPEEFDNVSSNLAEGFHTAFRKASSHPDAHQIWTLIRRLPEREWGNIIAFVMRGTFKKKTKARSRQEVPRV